MDPTPDGIPTVVLCADDFALAPGVSSGIRDLIEAGRLSATSCMAASPYWPEHAAWLDRFRNTVDIGLHLTLTDLIPLGPMRETAPHGRLPTFGRLVRAAFARRLVVEEIARELERQLDAFEEAFHAPPAFLDGHQHIHQLPGIREIVVDLFRRRLADSGAYLRVCHERAALVCRRGVCVGRTLAIGFPGLALRHLAHLQGIATNDGFSGIYDFTDRIPYSRMFGRFLIAARDRTLILCHPGLVDDELCRPDSLTHQREAEYRFFMGTAFHDALTAAGVRLGRFADDSE